MFDPFSVVDCLAAQEQMDSARKKAGRMDDFQLERVIASAPSSVVLRYHNNPLGLQRDESISLLHKRDYFLAIASAERVIAKHGIDYLKSIYGLE
jgi:hypothetical protein